MSKIYDALQHLEAQRRAMATGESPEEPATPLDRQEQGERPVAEPMAAERPVGVRASQPILEQTAAVTRFGAELQRRMGEAGLDGIQGLFALAEQLSRALATVSHQEIDHAEADLERVENQIRAMQNNLRQLKAVKVDLEGLATLPKL